MLLPKKQAWEVIQLNSENLSNRTIKYPFEIDTLCCDPVWEAWKKTICSARLKNIQNCFSLGVIHRYKVFLVVIINNSWLCCGTTQKCQMKRSGLWSGIAWSPFCLLYSVNFRELFHLFCNSKCIKHQILMFYWSFWCCSCKRLREGKCVFLLPLKQILLIKCEGCFQPRLPSFWSPVSTPLWSYPFSLTFFWISIILTCPSWASSLFHRALWILIVNVHLFCFRCLSGAAYIYMCVHVCMFIFLYKCKYLIRNK